MLKIDNTYKYGDKEKTHWNRVINNLPSKAKQMYEKLMAHDFTQSRFKWSGL